MRYQNEIKDSKKFITYKTRSPNSSSNLSIQVKVEKNRVGYPTIALVDKSKNKEKNSSHKTKTAYNNLGNLKKKLENQGFLTSNFRFLFFSITRLDLKQILGDKPLLITAILFFGDAATHIEVRTSCGAVCKIE